MRRPTLTVIVLTVLASVFVIGCGNGSDETSNETTTTTAATTTTEATTTTSTVVQEASTTLAPLPVDPTSEVDAADLAAPGPYPVGVTTRELPTGNLAEIWYPAGPEAEGASDTYRVSEFLPEIMAALVPDETDDGFTVEAGRDATPATGETFPLVLFSHGARAFRYQSTTLAHHLASWGFVVASADHPQRWLPGLLATPEDATDPAADVRAMRQLVVADPVLGAVIDAERVAASGHSAGGGTALEVAGDEGVAGYVSYASGVFDDAELPDVPSLFMAGALDTIVEPSRTRAAFEAAPAPSFHLEFAESGHLVFSDLCAIGGGDANLVDLAEAAGLGDFLPEQLVRLATDGCDPPNRPVADVWPGIHQSTTAFYRLVFGIDTESEGIAAPAVSGVTFEQKAD